MAAKRHKSDMVVEKFLEDIKNGRWKVGDKLPSEQKLLTEFDVSRVCLRESLIKLEVMGVLKIIQGDGTYVTEVNPANFAKPLFSIMSIDENSIHDIYEVRIALESSAYRKSALLRTEDDLKKLSGFVDRMEEAAKCYNFSEYSKYDRQFHDTIMKISEARLLIMFYDMFRDITNQYTYYLNTNVEIVERTKHEHSQILWAIAEKKEEFAAQLISMHLERSKRALLEKGVLDNMHLTNE